MRTLEEMVDQTGTFGDDGEEDVCGYRNMMIWFSLNVPALLTDEAIQGKIRFIKEPNISTLISPRCNCCNISFAILSCVLIVGILSDRLL